MNTPSGNKQHDAARSSAGRAPDGLWQPSRPEETNLWKFREALADHVRRPLDDYGELHAFSVEEPAAFWSFAWDYCGVSASEKGAAAVQPAEELWNWRFFPEARLNFADNLLRRRDDSPALIFRSETAPRRELSWKELTAAAAQVQAALDPLAGVNERVAAWLPNLPETCMLMLGAAAGGRVFSSCSPDFGVKGLLDRFGQIRPKVLVGVDGYKYGGKTFDCLGKLAEARSRLSDLERLVVFPYLNPDPDLSGLPGAQTWEEFLAEGASAGAEPNFVDLPFDHPLYVLYSSGTTGAPKSIVHRAGGLLLKHLVEHRLGCDVRPGDRAFYFTTAGWMMWNWLMSALASEATLVLYQGFPDPGALFDMADEEGITLFGTSAGFVEALARQGASPRRTHRLDTLKTITSTGSPLSPKGFEYVYEEVKADVHLASISGGTDLCGCLVMGDPASAVYAGEIQRPALGLSIDVYDEQGRSCAPGQVGELVCTNAFPSMPLGFWGDEVIDEGADAGGGGTRSMGEGAGAGAAGGPGEAASGAASGEAVSKYQKAYFRRFPGVWHQGDFAHWSVNGGMVILGRSDATLNPGGVRIGTAEIYRPLEGIPEVREAIVIGQQWQEDTRIVLFVSLADGVDELDEELTGKIRDRIRRESSPRHVPALVLRVDDVPRTRSGKLVEMAVADVVAGRPIRNTEAISNPEALEQYRDRPELGA